MASAVETIGLSQGGNRLHKKFLVIGLGRFGASVAQALIEMGQFVQSVDVNPARVDELAPILHRVVRADATDPAALRALRVSEYDYVVVAIGDNVEASVLTCLNCRDLGAKVLVAKAQDDAHGRVLERLGVDRVVYPQRDMGTRAAYSITTGSFVDFIRLSEEYGMVELAAPPHLVNHTLKELHLGSRYGLNVLAIRRGNEVIVSPRAEERIHEGDVIVLIGDARGISYIQGE